jgi:arsenate reductase
MAKILFICWGNVGRSQMAEAYYNHLTNSKDAFSAGTDPESPKKYPQMSKVFCDLMLDDGINMSSQWVKLIENGDVEKADRIYVLCEKKDCPDYVLKSEKVTFWEVDDPEFMSPDEMRKIRNQIKSLVKSII